MGLWWEESGDGRETENPSQKEKRVSESVALPSAEAHRTVLARAL